MVVKLLDAVTSALTEFESRVILDGSQTIKGIKRTRTTFESRVILDGSQTERPERLESDYV